MTETAHCVKASIEGRAADGVIDQIKSHAAGAALDIVVNGLGAIDERRPKLFDVSALRPRIGGEDLRAKCLGELDGHVPHASAATINQDFATCGEGSTIDQPFPSGNKNQRQHSGLTHRKVGRLKRDQIGIDRGIFSQRTLDAADAANHPIDFVTFVIPRHAGTNGFDGARHVQPEDRGRNVMGMCGCAVEDLGIERIDAAGGDPNEDLAPAWLRPQHIRHTEGCAVALEDCCFHGAHDMLHI